MKAQQHPFGFNYKEIYPDARLIKVFEGGRTYKATKGGKYYLIIDEGPLADFLDEDDKDILDQLIKVIEFETEEELNQYLRERYGKFSFR